MAPNKEIEKRPCPKLPAPYLLMGATTGDRSRGMAVFGPLRLTLEPLAVPLSRLRIQRQVWGRFLQWDTASRAGASWSASPSPRSPPIPFPCWKGSDRASSRKGGNLRFPVAFRLKAGSPGPLVNMAQDNWHFFRLQCVGQPRHLFPSLPRQARNQSSRGHMIQITRSRFILPSHELSIPSTYPGWSSEFLVCSSSPVNVACPPRGKPLLDFRTVQGEVDSRGPRLMLVMA